MIERLFPKWRMRTWVYTVQGAYGPEALYLDTNNIPTEAMDEIEARYERHYGVKGTVISFTEHNEI